FKQQQCMAERSAEQPRRRRYRGFARGWAVVRRKKLKGGETSINHRRFRFGHEFVEWLDCALDSTPVSRRSWQSVASQSMFGCRRGQSNDFRFVNVNSGGVSVFR